MSAETLEWLNENTLIGFTEKRGYFWHYDESLQNGELSNHYPGAIPMADVIKRLFNWDAVEVPINYTVNGKNVTPDGKKAIVHGDSGHFFYLASNRYQVHQYREWLLEKPLALLDASAGDLDIGSAGLLQMGGRAWVQLETPEGVTIGGDKLVPFIVCTTAHNGTGQTEYKRGFNRVGCDNTLDGFMFTNEPSIKVRHTTNAKLKVGEARQILEIGFKDQLEREMAEIVKLVETPITDDEFRKLVVAAVPYKNDTKNAVTIAEKMRAGVVDLWERSPMIIDIKGTAWGAIQAFNTYAQHSGRTRGSVLPEKVKLDFLSGKVAATDTDVLETMKVLELVK